MLKIAVIDDEIRDLLGVVRNLIDFKPAESIQVLPILISDDGDMTIDSYLKEAEFDANLGVRNGDDRIEFPRIIKMGPLDFSCDAAHRLQMLDQLREHEVEMIITDASMKDDFAGIKLLEAARSADWSQYWQCWVMTKVADVDRRILNQDWNQFDPRANYLRKTEILKNVAGCEAHLKSKVELARVQSQAQATSHQPARESFRNLLGASAAMNNLYRLIESIARSTATVLITGETGTGKELVAKAIHEVSPRRDKPWVARNLGALPANLQSSALFGWVKGAFTGTVKDQESPFEIANGGSVFLDEIGDISPELQNSLLRVVQEHVLSRLGSQVEVKVDCRIICATNRDLRQAVIDGIFREDLYYRLSVIPLEVPPLRKREGDAALLVEHFIKQFNGESGGSLFMHPEELDKVRTANYKWPGNVRALENCIERLSAIKVDGPITAQEVIESIDQYSPFKAALEIRSDSEELDTDTPDEVFKRIINRKLCWSMPKLQKEYGTAFFAELYPMLASWIRETFHREHLDEAEAKNYFGQSGAALRKWRWNYEQDNAGKSR